MQTHSIHTRLPVARAVYALLNPIPFGFFVGGLIFDIVYANSGTILWVKAAAWLITLGLLFAIVPRLINLFHVWRPKNHTSSVEKADFGLNLVAVVLAIVNAFIHTRDAYAAMPDGAWLSAATVLLMSLGLVFVAVKRSDVIGSANA